MKRIVIIGAGPAGLTAAYTILKKSSQFEVIILEEEKQVGGISKTITYNNNKMDLGGHRFFSKSRQINNLWQEILPLQGKPSYDDKILNKKKNFALAGPDPEQETKTLLIRNRVSRIYYQKKFFDYPISLKFKVFKALSLKTTLWS